MNNCQEKCCGWLWRRKMFS